MPKPFPGMCCVGSLPEEGGTEPFTSQLLGNVGIQARAASGTAGSSLGKEAVTRA